MEIKKLKHKGEIRVKNTQKNETITYTAPKSYGAMKTNGWKCEGCINWTDSRIISSTHPCLSPS